jgi:hypothetical protein
MNRTNIVLALILVALVAIFGFMMYEQQDEPTIGERVNEVTDEVGDEIDDATTN